MAPRPHVWDAAVCGMPLMAFWGVRLCAWFFKDHVQSYQTVSKIIKKRIQNRDKNHPKSMKRRPWIHFGALPRPGTLQVASGHFLQCFSGGVKGRKNRSCSAKWPILQFPEAPWDAQIGSKIASKSEAFPNTVKKSRQSDFTAILNPTWRS